VPRYLSCVESVVWRGFTNTLLALSERTTHCFVVQCDHPSLARSLALLGFHSRFAEILLFSAVWFSSRAPFPFIHSGEEGGIRLGAVLVHGAFMVAVECVYDNRQRHPLALALVVRALLV